MVKGVQATPKVSTGKLQPIDESPIEPETLCPKCGNQLVELQAKRGVKAGNTFLGCSAFPKCRFTIDTQTIQG